jgi:hypothetical protein
MSIPVGVARASSPDTWVVVVKLSYALDASGRASLAPAQDPLTVEQRDGSGVLLHPSDFVTPKPACDVLLVGSLLAAPARRAALRAGHLRKQVDAHQALGAITGDASGQSAPSDQRVLQPNLPLELTYESDELVMRASIDGPLPGLTLIDPGAWAPPRALPLSLDTVSIDPPRARVWLTLRALLEGAEAMLERATVLLAPNGAAGPGALGLARDWPRYEAVAPRSPLPKPVATRSLTIPPTAQGATLPFARASSAPRAPGSLPPSGAGLPFGAPPAPSFVDESAGGSALPFVDRAPSEAPPARPRPLMSLGGTPLAYPPTPFANRTASAVAHAPSFESSAASGSARAPVGSELDPGLDDDTGDASPEELDGPDTLAPPTASAHASDEDDHADTLPPGTQSSPPGGVAETSLVVPAPAALPRFETISMPAVTDDGPLPRPSQETMPFFEVPRASRPETAPPAALGSAQLGHEAAPPMPAARPPVVPPPAVIAPPAIVVPQAVVAPMVVTPPQPVTPPSITAPRAVELPTYAREAQERSFAMLADTTSSRAAASSTTEPPPGKRIQGKTLRELGEIRNALWSEPEKRRAILRSHGLSELRWRLVERAWAEELESTLAQPERVSEMVSALRVAARHAALPTTP